MDHERHEHCIKCINLVKCRKLRSKKESSCDLVICHLDCGATYHACKENEHRLLCSKEKVTCINAFYGCPIILEQCERGKHLKVCPASVVHCTMTYDHWPVPPVNSSSHCQNGSDYKYATIKDEEVESLHNSPTGLTTFSDISASGINNCMQWKTFKPFSLNPKDPYTFSCDKDFRRGEFESHFKNMHNDLQSCLYGWVEQWCPLAQYGCNFTRQRFQPYLHSKNNQHSNTSQVVYNENLQAFGVTNCDESSRELVKPSPSDDLLSQLPNEVLLVITSYLDSFSLNNLSLTSSRLRFICQSLLVQKGLVIPLWEKTDDGNQSWNITKYRWIFSVATSPVPKWRMSDIPPLSEHIRHCPHFIAYSCATEVGLTPTSDRNSDSHKHMMAVIKEYRKTPFKRDRKLPEHIRIIPRLPAS